MAWKAAAWITNWKQRILEALRNAPVGVKVMGVAMGLTLFLGGALAWQIRHAYYELEVREVRSYAVFTARMLAAGATPLLREGNLDQIQRLIDQTAFNGPDIHLIQVRDRSGRVIAETVSDEPRARFEEGAAELPADVGGGVRVLFNHDHADYELGWHTRRILLATGVICAFGAGLTLWLMRWLIRPIRELVELARAVKAGNYQARALVRRLDEPGELTATFNEMLEALEQKEAINRQLLRKTIAATEEERKRVARELHDQTGQSLTSLIAGLAALEQGSQAAKVAELRGLAARILGEVHDLSLRLRPSALEDLGLLCALRKFCQGVAKRYEVQVDCEAVGFEDDGRLPDEMEVALYRICQEAVTNALRHGRARHIDVLLQRKEDSVLAVIEDDGCGFEAGDWRGHCLRKDRLGLLGVEERAVLLGGSLRLESRPGSGASLFIELPLPALAYA